MTLLGNLYNRAIARCVQFSYDLKSSCLMLSTTMRSDDEISLVSSISSTATTDDAKDSGHICGCLPLNSPSVGSSNTCKNSTKSTLSPSFFHRSPRNRKATTSLFKDSRIISHVIPTSLTDPEISERKVPMDFSLPKARIVRDPDEVMNVINEERMRTKEKIRLHSPDSRMPQVNCYLAQPWFHHGISREEAVNVLKVHNFKEGTFLIRLSNRLPGCFVLTLAHNNSVLHYPISSMRTLDDEAYLTLDGGRTKFRDLLQLVNFYEINDGGFLPALLQNYITHSVFLSHHVNTLMAPSSL